MFADTAVVAIYTHMFQCLIIVNGNLGNPASPGVTWEKWVTSVTLQVQV
jgi:hypothetical protein